MALYEVQKGDSIWAIAQQSLGMQYPEQQFTSEDIADEMLRIISINMPKLNVKQMPGTPGPADLIYSGLVLDIGGGAGSPADAIDKGKGKGKNIDSPSRPGQNGSDSTFSGGTPGKGGRRGGGGEERDDRKPPIYYAKPGPGQDRESGQGKALRYIEEQQPRDDRSPPIGYARGPYQPSGQGRAQRYIEEQQPRDDRSPPIGYAKGPYQPSGQGRAQRYIAGQQPRDDRKPPIAYAKPGPGQDRQSGQGKAYDYLHRPAR